jgi:aspartate racemase
MKTVGIVGGIGPESTVEYYRFIIEGYRAAKSDGSYPSIIINSIDLSKLVGWMNAGQLDDVTDYLVTEIEKLERAGVDFALLASNTPHIVFNEVRARVTLPLISIVEATRDRARDLKLQRPALFGTRFTMQGKFYPEVFAEAGINIVIPNEAERAFIHEKYMGELLNNIFLPETRERLIAIVNQMKQREGIDGLILGGTELPLILRDAEIEGVPFLDTTRIHVERIVAALLEAPPARRYRGWPPADGSAVPDVAASDGTKMVEPSEQLVEVRLGVSTPSELSPGEEFVARFAAYTPVFKAEVERIFKEEAPSSRPRFDLESTKWKKGARVTVSLRATHVQIDNPVQTFEWNGEKNILRFDARVLPEASGKALILKFDIAVEGLSLLTLRPEIQLSATPGSASPQSVVTERPAPRTAFASYAHADKVEVFNRISSVVSFTGIDFFTDDVSIIPGEQWKARLESEIKNRDLFLLFWSRHAQESTYVDWEWRTALAAKRDILPQALEPAEVAPPPKELSDLQFGGVYERLISSLRKP